MKRNFLLFIILTLSLNLYAGIDSVVVPIQRQLFHDRINEEQQLFDKADGKMDGLIKASVNEEINLAVTDVLLRKINQLQDEVELNTKLATNNDKVRYLNYIESVLKSFRKAWKTKQISLVYAPGLIDNFEKIMKANLEGQSMVKFIKDVPYEIGKINAEVFPDNKGYKESRNLVYLKYIARNPSKILQTIEPYVMEPYADSLLAISTKRNPAAIYSLAQAPNTPIGRLVHRSTNPMVTSIVELSNTPNALLYFPFLDDILKGKKTIEQIKKYVGDGEKGYDSVGYYKLLVQTEIEYFKRLAPPMRDTPVAMFGPNGLREVLQGKALQHFINPINMLHDLTNLDRRMKAIDSLAPVDIYYMMVMGENDIYTSSYKHSFNRMIQRMGPNPRSDSLLYIVHFDYFKKFIKMAANYNFLDQFLKLMPPPNSETVMRGFVANLDNTGNLEDATDVADAYSSINDPKLLQTILGYVKDNERRSIQNNKVRGKLIYGILKTIFLSADSSNRIDLSAELGIPSIYTVENQRLMDDSGRIVQQVFWYGDEDGKSFFPSFVNSFSRKNWSVVQKKEWVEIKSLKGQKVWIYANRPLDNNSNLDDSAQIHLNNYLSDNELQPTVITHRGHSYWLDRTIKRMPGDAKVIVLGSCGGYKNLKEILQSSPDAHIISTKQIGAGNITQPILNYLNQSMLSGKPLVWKTMWAELGTKFTRADRETWDDYIPPYKNLGAIFIKAYQTKEQQN